MASSSSSHSLVLSRIAAFDVPYGLVDASASAASKPSALYVKFQKLSDGHESDGYLPTAVRTTSLTERPEPAIFKDAELVLPLATGWRGGKLKVTVWDEALGATDESGALGHIVVDIARASQALPVVKLVIVKGTQAFKVGFTHQIVETVSEEGPLAKCLAIFGAGGDPRSAEQQQAAKEEEAARVLQSAAKKREATKKGKAMTPVVYHGTPMEGDEASPPAKKTPGSSIVGIFTRSKTRPPREAEKEHPGRERGPGRHSA